jgi:hypothetical protein
MKSMILQGTVFVLQLMNTNNNVKYSYIISVQAVIQRALKEVEICLQKKSQPTTS